MLGVVNLADRLKEKSERAWCCGSMGQHFYKASATLSWRAREFMFFVVYLAPSQVVAGVILDCRKLLIFFLSYQALYLSPVTCILSAIFCS